MPDSVLENAERARDELAAKINSHQAQIDDWRRDMARIEQFIEYYHMFSVVNVGDGRLAIRRVEEESRRRTTGNSSKEEVSKTARWIIGNATDPIPRPALLAALRKQGLVIEGAEPETVLSTMLWRTRNDYGVVHLKGKGYRLREHINQMGPDQIEEEGSEESGEGGKKNDIFG